MTVYRANAWRDVIEDRYYPPAREHAVPQEGRSLAQVRRRLRAHGKTLLGTCERSDGGEAELWGDSWPTYDRNAKVVAIWEDAGAVHA